MKKICIISDIHDWHSNQIKSQLLKKGYEVIKCSFNDIDISFNRSSKAFSIKNKKDEKGIEIEISFPKINA